MKKKIIAIALVASLTAGSALQAKEKTVKKMDKAQKATITPIKPITDPKELNKQIRDITRKIRKTTSKRDRLVEDRTKAANKGNESEVNQLTDKIRAKDARIVKHRALMRMYTMRLVTAKTKEMAKEKKTEPKKKVKMGKKERAHKKPKSKKKSK